jgi:hypothetical protein
MRRSRPLRRRKQLLPPPHMAAAGAHRDFIPNRRVTHSRACICRPRLRWSLRSQNHGRRSRHRRLSPIALRRRSGWWGLRDQWPRGQTHQRLLSAVARPQTPPPQTRPPRALARSWRSHPTSLLWSACSRPKPVPGGPTSARSASTLTTSPCRCSSRRRHRASRSPLRRPQHPRYPRLPPRLPPRQLRQHRQHRPQPHLRNQRHRHQHPRRHHQHQHPRRHRRRRRRRRRRHHHRCRHRHHHPCRRKSSSRLCKPRRHCHWNLALTYLCRQSSPGHFRQPQGSRRPYH